MKRLTDFELQQFEQQLINDGTDTQVRKLIDEVKDYRAKHINYTYELVVNTAQDGYLFRGVYFCQDETEAKMMYNKIKSQYKDDARWFIVVKDSKSKIVYSIILSDDNGSEI